MLPQGQQDALAQAEEDLRTTDRRPLDERFLTQPLDDTSRAKREAVMDVRQRAWEGADIKADDVLNLAWAQYTQQPERDRVVIGMIDTDPTSSKRKTGKKLLPYPYPFVPYDRLGGPTGLPLAA